MLTLHCTDREMNDGSASEDAIAVSGSTTAVAMTSWPKARGAQHGSVRLALGKRPACTCADGNVAECMRHGL